jgi:hypothetical protein
VAAAFALAACVVSPLPEPPPLAPLDPMDLTATCLACDGRLHIEGRPGAAPPGALVWVITLDEPFAPTTGLVATDGSFFVEASGGAGDAFRLQVRQDGVRSAPTDVSAALDGSLAPLAQSACLNIALELMFEPVAVGDTQTRAVTVRNGCGQPVSIDRVELRAPSDAYVIVDPSGGNLGAGGTRSFEVRFTPPASGLHEEVLLLGVTRTDDPPALERRAVTLSGVGLDP